MFPVQMAATCIFGGTTFLLGNFYILVTQNVSHDVRMFYAER
jgi:hypothetical protein